MSPADRRIWERRVEVQRQAGRRRLKILVAGLLVVLLAVATLVVLHSPLLAADHVTISGGAGIARAEVIDAAGLQRRPPLIDIDTAAMERRLEQIPVVAAATVTLEWPTGVRILLTERTPVAVTPAGLGTGPAGEWAVLDASGRVLEVVTARPPGLPEIVGAGHVGGAGSYLPAAAGELLRAAQSVLPALAPYVVEIGRDAAGDLVLSLRGGMVALLGDDSEMAQKVISLMTLLDKADLHGIATIDLRVPGAPVLTPSGAGPTLRVQPGG